MTTTTYIVVDDQQASVLSGCDGPVQVRDRAGKHLGYVTRSYTPEEIAEAQRRLLSDSPRYTTEQVLAHLRSLERS
jgi:hypothetical protein